MSRTEIVASGFGLAAIILSPQASPMLVSLNQTLLHYKYSLATVALGLLLDFTLLGVLCSLVVFGVSRFADSVLKRVAIVLLISLGIRFARHAFLLWINTRLSWAASRLTVQILSIVLLILAVGFARRFDGALGKFRFLVPGIGIFAAVMWFQLVRFAVVSDRITHQPPPLLAASFPQATLTRRVVWIVFDELSYREAFEKARSNGLSLPTFESLRGHSIFFRDVVPAGYMTEYAVPGLLLGSPVDDVKATTPRNFSIRFAAKAGYTSFDPQATIFGELHREHLNSAVAGWYHPYCDVLALVLSSCEWDIDIMTPPVPGMFTEQTVLQNVVGFVADRVRRVRAPKSGSVSATRWDIIERNQSYSHLMSAARSAIANPAISLVFVHLPLPHPPGFYNRHTQSLASSGSYLDNLALCDRTLQILLDAIHNSPAADVTTVIVTTDHSWRINIWQKETGWTPEDQAIAPGEFDPRIPLLVHLPNQNQGLEIDQPFEAIRTRSLITAILHGQLETPTAVGAWSEEDRTLPRPFAAQ